MKDHASNSLNQILGDSLGSAEVSRERLFLEATELLSELLERNDVSRAELARRLTVSPPAITALLNGSQNLTLGRLSDVLHAIGYELHLHPTLQLSRITAPQLQGEPSTERVGDAGSTPGKQTVRTTPHSPRQDKRG